MRRRSAAAVSTTVPRSDSSSAIRRSSSSDGDSSPRTITRSTLVSARAIHGSTGQATNSETSVRAKVRMPQGSRIAAYSVARQPTGSRRLRHSQLKKPPSSPPGMRLGSSTWSASSDRARRRSSRASQRLPSRPTASTGSPPIVTAMPTPTVSHIRA